MKKIFITFIILAITAAAISSQGQKISSPFSQAKFVPNISAILDFAYVFRDLADVTFDSMYIPGYIPAGEEYHYGLRGFNFNYFELALESVVDPYFDLFAVFQFTEGDLSIEEAYFKTRSLPGGFQIKAGKFFSGFGRLNSQHDHMWNFCDQPLIYKTIFGATNLNDLGVQLNWVAPTPFFLLAGIEMFQGQNSDSNSFYNNDFTLHGKDFLKSSRPLLVSFIKTSANIGNFILLGGTSLATGTSNRSYEETDSGMNARCNVVGVDITVKYLIDSYRYLNWQSEVFFRTFRGDGIVAFQIDDFKQNHSGFYSELVWRFSRRWRCGFRYDFLKESSGLFLVDSHDIHGNLDKMSAMVEFNTTEFSRIRIQYNLNNAKVFNDELKTFSELFITCNLAIGAHGAHKF